MKYCDHQSSILCPINICFNSHPLSVYALRIGNKSVLIHSSLLCSWNDSNKFNFFILAPSLITYLIVRWLAKSLHFFMEIYSFLLCLLLWNKSFRKSILCGQGKQVKFFFKKLDKNLSLFGNLSFNVSRKSRRKSHCLPDTMKHLYWKTTGWIQRQTKSSWGFSFCRTFQLHFAQQDASEHAEQSAI